MLRPINFVHVAHQIGGVLYNPPTTKDGGSSSSALVITTSLKQFPFSCAYIGYVTCVNAANVCAVAIKQGATSLPSWKTVPDVLACMVLNPQLVFALLSFKLQWQPCQSSTHSSLSKFKCPVTKHIIFDTN